MCKELKDFYKAYSDWVHYGAIEGCPFTRHSGLCGSLALYCHQKGWSFNQRNNAAAVMKAQFGRAGLSILYPFNTGRDDYGNEVRKGEAHLNNNRIMWVRKEWKHYV